jgi:hypothetical protein
MSLFIESRKDKVPIEIRLDYKGSKEINDIPAIVIGHPYGPLGIDIKEKERRTTLPMLHFL